MRINVPDETIELENKITKALTMAKEEGLEKVIEFLEKVNKEINESYER